MANGDDRTKELERQYALTRQRLKGERKRSLQRLGEEFNRFAAASQLQPGSGALMKAHKRFEEDIGQQFGEQI